MATLYIRTLSPETYERLKERAKRHRRSITQEAATLLEQALAHPEGPAEGWARVGALQERLRDRYRTFKDSTALLRDDRRR